MKKLNHSQKGFTVVELMIATVVFSLMLMTAAAMLIQIGRLYYKGVITARTQNATRAITDDISRALQFSGATVRVGTPTSYATSSGSVEVESFCIDRMRYSFSKNKQVSTTVGNGDYVPGGTLEEHRLRHALWRDESTDPSCTPLNLALIDPSSSTPTGTTSTNGREMVGEGMRLFMFGAPTNPDPIGAPDLWDVKVGVIYGPDSDVIEGLGTIATNPEPPVFCRGSIVGSQWCAGASLKTTVYRRLE